MRLLLHTMATPDLDPLGAVALAARLGLDGLELVRQDGYRCALPEAASAGEARELGMRARDKGVPVVVLSPYDRALEAANDAQRARALAGMRHAMAQARALGAQRVRVLAGQEIPEEDWEPALERLVGSLRALADEADGLSLDIENHPGTMADDVARTMRIWQAVGHPAVGVIYDPGNLTREGREAFPASLDMQARAIRHVHVKDYVFAPHLRDGRRATVPGDGELGWPAILHALARQGYGGDLSLEYEMRWVPDELPPPEAGLARARDAVRRCWPAIPGQQTGGEA